MPADLQTIVQRMIDAGEPEEAIAEVIQSYRPTASSGAPATPIAATGIGAAKLAPAIVSGANKLVPAIANLGKRGGGAGPVTLGITAGVNAAQGNYKTAAATGAAALAPSAAQMVQKATAAAGSRATPILSASGEAMSIATKPGMMTRGAGWLSRMASGAALPLSILSSLSDSFQYGQGQAAKLDDPTLSQEEQDEILRQLHSAGGF